MEHSNKFLEESAATNKGLLEGPRKLVDEDTNVRQVWDDDPKTIENLRKELDISEKGNQTLLNNLKESKKDLKSQNQINEDLEASIASGFRSLFSKYADVLGHLGAVTSEELKSLISRTVLIGWKKILMDLRTFALFLGIIVLCLARKQFLGSWKPKVISF